MEKHYKGFVEELRQALIEGRIAASRFASYLSVLEDQDEGKYRAAH